MSFSDWLAQLYEQAVAYLPGWSDNDILDCDLSRLQRAITASVKRVDEDRKHAESIHGVERKPAYEPPKNEVEQVERAKATFASLGTTIVG